MSDFTIYNPFDQTTQTADDGDTIQLNIPAGSYTMGPTLSVIVRAEATSNLVDWYYSGTEYINLQSLWNSSTAGDKPIALIQFQQAGYLPGAVTEAGIGTGGTAVVSGSSTTAVAAFGKNVKLVFNYVSINLIAKPITWLPAGIYDIQWEWMKGDPCSSLLAPMQQGLKQGATLNLGIIPALAGTPIIADISSLTVTLRPSLDMNDYGILAQTVVGTPTPTDESGNKFYPAALVLESQKIDQVFGELNSTVDDAIAGNITTDPATANAAAKALDCILEIQAVHTSGTYTTRNLPIRLLQSLSLNITA